MSPIKVDFGKYGDVSNIAALSNTFKQLEKSRLFDILQNGKPGEGMLLTPKEMIMIMLADRTSVYLDIKGYKFHFMQPDSLRALSDMFYLLYNMENLNEFKRKDNGNRNDEDKFQQSRNKNRKILLDYLHFKMLPENNFPAETEELVNCVLDSPMERRGRIIWDYYFTLLSTNKNRERIINLYGLDFYEEEMNRYKIEKYSFGALYRVLYSATRLNVIDRKVVIFLLASFAFSMPNFIELEKARNNPNIGYEKSDDYIRIREAFDYSLIGTWCKDLLGCKDVNIVIDKPNGAYNESFIKKLLYVLALVSSDTSKPLNVEENDSHSKYIIKAEIDPTAFIINSFMYSTKIKTTKLINGDNQSLFVFVEKLYTGEDITFKKNPDKESTGEENTGKENSSEESPDKENPGEESTGKKSFDDILKDVESDLTKKSADFLLKHTDLSYNVIKRVISDMIYTSDNNLKVTKKPTDNPAEIISEFYQKIIENN